MALKKKINFRKVRNVIRDKRVDKLYKQGADLKGGVINRTRNGRDVNLKSFKNYSDTYKKYKKKKE